eukprot:1071558-Rhodomonas_salina.2
MIRPELEQPRPVNGHHHRTHTRTPSPTAAASRLKRSASASGKHAMMRALVPLTGASVTRMSRWLSQCASARLVAYWRVQVEVQVALSARRDGHAA